MSLARIARRTFVGGLFGTLLIAGFIPYLYNLQWPVLACLGLSALSAVLWVVFSLDRIHLWTKQRGTQWGLSLVITAVAAVGILVVVNWAANAYNVKKDVTQNQFHSLSDQTRNIAGGLKENITIRVWSMNIDRMSVNLDMRRFLENYRIAGKGKIKVEILNPNENRPEAERDGVKRDNILIVRAASGREARIETFNDAKGEEQLTNSLIQATHGAKGRKTVCFLAGHGELSLANTQPDGLSNIKEQLENSQYTTKEISLATTPENKVPAECEALVIAGPRSEPLEHKEGLNEIASLKAFLSAGGKMVALFGSATPEKWKQLASDYGVNIRQDLVLDPRVRPPFAVATKNFAQDVDFVKAFDAMVILPESSSIDVSGAKKDGGVSVRTFLSSESFAYAKAGNLRSLRTISPVGNDIRGPVPLGVLITQPVTAAPAAEKAPEKKEAPKAKTSWNWPSLVPEARAQDDGHGHAHEGAPPEGLPPGLGGMPPKEEIKDGPKDLKNEMNLILVANHAFLMNSFVTQSGNADLFLNSVNYLLKDQDLIGIRPREVRQTSLKLSNETRRQVRATMLIVGLAFLWGAFLVRFRRSV